jgi:hypothetical protein
MTTENLGIKYTCDENGIKATWELRISEWADIEAKIDSVNGSEVTIGGSSFTIGVSTLPGRQNVLLKSVEFEPWVEKCGVDDANGLPTCPEGAKVTLNFETLVYELQPGSEGEAFMTHSIDSNANMMTHAQSGLAWRVANGDTLGKDDNPGWPVVLVHHDFKWMNVYDPPLTSIYGLLGKLNATPFFGHAIGTVIFDKLTANYSITTNGVRKYEVSMGCTARIIHGASYDGGYITWNHFLRADAADGENPWQLVVHKSSGAPNPEILQYAELNDLLTLFNYSHAVAQSVVV